MFLNYEIGITVIMIKDLLNVMKFYVYIVIEHLDLGVSISSKLLAGYKECFDRTFSQRW